MPLKTKEGDLAGNQAWILQPHQNQMFCENLFRLLLVIACGNPNVSAPGCWDPMSTCFRYSASKVQGGEREGEEIYIHHPSGSVSCRPSLHWSVIYWLSPRMYCLLSQAAAHCCTYPHVALSLGFSSSRSTRLSVIKWPTNPYCSRDFWGHVYSRKPRGW